MLQNLLQDIKNDKGDGYRPFAEMFARNKVTMIFTCLEMRDSEQMNCDCAPQELVTQTMKISQAYNIPYSGENALQRYDNYAYDQIVQTNNIRLLHSFTYLRLVKELFYDDNWSNFKNFVRRMHNI